MNRILGRIANNEMTTINLILRLSIPYLYCSDRLPEIYLVVGKYFWAYPIFVDTQELVR
ncbi:MAG: hypothetical protein HPY52_16195 [Firmicutes bacterium]|nr:hypothetical protein [Bacillota bacterium]